MPRSRPSQHVLPSDPALYAPDAQRPLRMRARHLAAATRVVPHRHPWAQLVFSSTGVLHVSADEHTYIVPPSRAVWVPPQVEHAVNVIEDAELRTLYLHQDHLPTGPQPLAAQPTSDRGDWSRCRVLEVSPLLRELVEQLPRQLPTETDPERERCLVALVQDELCRARPVPLGIGLPQDKRLRALCEAVLENPARHASLQGWALEAGASVRTVSRLFRQELGTSFAAWRQQVLLAKALSMAARKRPVAHIAAELGYASASAFTAMVRRSVGMPPSQFFAA